MSTPSTGPDEREAEVERIAGLLDELVSEACDLERYSTWDRRAGSEESSRVEIARLQSEVLSALRAARRDTERLDEVQRLSIEGDHGVIVYGKFAFAEPAQLWITAERRGCGADVRAAIDESLKNRLSVPPILERNDRGNAS